jgi:hypothetical protein
MPVDSTWSRFVRSVVSAEQRREVSLGVGRSKTVPVILGLLAVAAVGLLVFAVYVLATA